MSDLTRAFEDESAQRALFDYGVWIFRESRRSVPSDALYKLDMLWAEREAAMRQRRGEPSREHALAAYERELCRQLRRYSVPHCFGKRGAYKGVYAPLRAAEVLLGVKCPYDEIRALERLSAARIDAPEVPGMAGGGGSFDPMDPSTWSTSLKILY